MLDVADVEERLPDRFKVIGRIAGGYYDSGLALITVDDETRDEVRFPVDETDGAGVFSYEVLSRLDRLRDRLLQPLVIGYDILVPAEKMKHRMALHVQPSVCDEESRL